MKSRLVRWCRRTVEADVAAGEAIESFAGGEARSLLVMVFVSTGHGVLIGHGDVDEAT